MSIIITQDRIDVTIAETLEREGYGTYRHDTVVTRVARALIEREERIAEQIVSEVVRQFGVSENEVQARLADTGMSVRGADLDDEAEIDDEDEKDALFTDEDEDTRPPAQKESDGSVSSAVAALIRAITARLA